MIPKSILVTGGAGFIGSEFIRKIVKENFYSKIFIIDKLTYAADLSRITKELEISGVELIIADIAETSKYEKILSKIEVVVHFAAESHVDNSINDGMPFLKSNITGTYTLLNSIRHNSDARTIIVSTDEVYGSLDIGEFSETSPLNGSSPYSASKAAADLLALAQFKTFAQDIVITRSCNNYGPMQNPEKYIPKLIKNILANQEVPIYGKGTNIREWIHVSDHVAALIKLISTGRSGEIYNIGTGERFTNLEVLNIIKNIINRDVKINFVTDRLGHDYRYALNSSKIKSLIDWNPSHLFVDGIRDLINFEIYKFENSGIYS